MLVAFKENMIEWWCEDEGAVLAQRCHAFEQWWQINDMISYDLVSSMECCGKFIKKCC